VCRWWDRGDRGESVAAYTVRVRDVRVDTAVYRWLAKQPPTSECRTGAVAAAGHTHLIGRHGEGGLVCTHGMGKPRAVQVTLAPRLVRPTQQNGTLSRALLCAQVATCHGDRMHWSAL
jgi:hypothetical protein